MLWTSIRCERAAAEQLEAYRVGLERAIKAGQCPHPTEDGATRVSLGQALLALLRKQRGHSARSARHAAKRRKRLQKPATSGPTGLDVIVRMS